MTRLVLPALALAVFLSACSFTKDDAVSTGDLLVANGGNFSDQNGYLSVIDRSEGVVHAGMDLGGFVHALVVHERRAYVLINTFGEGRIDVFNLEEGGPQRMAQWTGLPAPRDIDFSETSAWVTNFVFGSPGTVQEVDLVTGTVVRSVVVSEAPEGVLVTPGGVLVAQNGYLGSGRTVARIDPGTGAVSQIPVSCDGPRDLVLLGSSRVMLVCTGLTRYSDDFSAILEQTEGRVLVLDQTSLETISSVDLPAQAGTANGTRTVSLSVETGEAFVMLADGSIQVVTTDVLATAGRIHPQEDPSVAGVSGLAYDPAEDRLYVGRLARSAAGPFPDYTASGQVHRVRRDGAVDARWTVGPAPSALVFP